MSVTLPMDVLYKTPEEAKTFGFDFQSEGTVKNNATLSSPIVTVTSGSGITVGTPVVIAAEFLDGGTGKKIPAGKGVAVRLSGGTPGRYYLSCKVATSDGDTLEIFGSIEVVVQSVV